MKDILIQMGRLFVGIFCCAVQLVAMIVSCIIMMLDAFATMLDDGAEIIMEKIKPNEEEKSEEEVPT